MIKSLIVAIARNNVIGCKNRLPWDLPADLEYFREKTKGKPVIMGYRTHLSIGKILPGRMNIVLCDSPDLIPMKGAVVASSFDEAMDLAKDSDEVFIIGGAYVYKQGLEYADRLYITEIDTDAEGDIYFPQFNKNQWKEVSRRTRKADDENIFDMDFVVYNKIGQ